MPGQNVERMNIYFAALFSTNTEKHIITSRMMKVLEVEDIVLVPVGKESALKPAEIVKIDYFDKENAPYPINKVKKIIRKCTFDDLKSFVDMNDDVFFYKDPTSEK